MGVTETGVAVALRVDGVVRAPDVPDDFLGPVAGYNTTNNDTGVRREGSGDGRGTEVDITRTTDSGDGECVVVAMMN